MRQNITSNLLKRLEPREKPYFIRSTSIKGFAVKINPSGSIRYIAETRYMGETYRKTIGSYPILSIQEAGKDTLKFLRLVQTGQIGKDKQVSTLQELLHSYMTTVALKPNTVRNYNEVVTFYLSDWLGKPVASISKQMVEKKFYQIRDKGISGGKPTYSQATKTMRILSALMNYARADEIIESNPVDVLKLKRVDRSIKKRENYLPASKVQQLLKITTQEIHPVALAVHLILHTGLRKNEALEKIRY